MIAECTVHKSILMCCCIFTSYFFSTWELRMYESVLITTEPNVQQFLPSCHILNMQKVLITKMSPTM